MTVQLMTAVRAGRIGLVGLALAALLTTSASAAIVSWSAPVTISGDSDVVTTGTLERAYNVHQSKPISTGPAVVISPTVNGVTFTSFPIDSNGTDQINFGIGATNSYTIGNTTLSVSANGVGALNVFGSGSAPFSGLTTAYRDLLQTTSFDNYNTVTVEPLVLTLSGLTSGTMYLFQTWANDSRAIIISTRTLTVTSGSTSGALDFNTTNSGGGVGQYVVGTFTADSTSQVFTYQGTASSQVLGFQLRVVPEPSSFALLLFGTVGLWLMKRKRGV